MKRLLVMTVSAGIAITLALFLPYSAAAAESYEEATESTWGIISSDDGFDKKLTIYKDGDNYGIDDYGDDIEYTIEIQ